MLRKAFYWVRKAAEQGDHDKASFWLELASYHQLPLCVDKGAGCPMHHITYMNRLAAMLSKGGALESDSVALNVLARGDVGGRSSIHIFVLHCIACATLRHFGIDYKSKGGALEQHDKHSCGTGNSPTVEKEYRSRRLEQQNAFGCIHFLRFVHVTQKILKAFQKDLDGDYHL